MKKADREKLFNKYGGKCAYCGCELTKGWHADHVKAVVRIQERVGQGFINTDTGQPATEEEMKYWITGEGNPAPIQHSDGKLVTRRQHYPENDHIGNMMPSCPSCNIYKHTLDIEGFRDLLHRNVESLNKNYSNYKFAKRFGLVKETGATVKFYFETIDNHNQL